MSKHAATSWVIAVCGAAYAVGVGLLAFGVWVDLGPLSAYGDPQAFWPIAVQVVAGGAAFGTWWWVNRRHTRPFAVVLLGFGILTVVVLSAASYSRCPEAGQSHVWSWVSRVVGLVSNNYAVDQFKVKECPSQGPPLALQFGRLAQLVVLLVAATSALTALLRGQLDRIRVRWARRVWLVIGADEAAAALLPALALAAEGTIPGVITTDPVAPWVNRARAAGWKVVVGEPHSRWLLRTLLNRGSAHALRGLAVLAPDSTDTQRLMRTVEDALDGSRARGPVRALLRIDDPWQAEDLRRRYLGRIDRWIVDTISANEVTARLLVEDALARGADVLVVTGHSDLTFAVVAEVAQQARERLALQDQRPMPRVVLVGPTAGEVVEEYALSQRRFGNHGSTVPQVEDRRVEDVVDDELSSGAVGAVLFTGGVQSSDQRLAARLGAIHPALFVYTHRTEVTGLGSEPLLSQVRAFGLTLDAGGGRPVDNWERLAQRMHEAYLSNRGGRPAEKASQLPWSELSQFYRGSNVRQLLTVLSSAVAVGRSWGADGDPAPPSTAQLTTMARLEQESWCRYYRRHRWAHGPVHVEGRTHPDLLGWDELGEEGRQKTIEGVEHALALLATLGYHSFDDPKKQWQRFRRTGEVVAVRRDDPWTWRTGDGTEMTGAAGDWEVTDASGTRSIKPDIFAATHRHLDGDRWARTGEVEARPAVPGETIESLEGTATAREGQWVLRGTESEQWLVPESHLNRSYDKVDG